MKNTVSILSALLFLCFSCNNIEEVDYTISETPTETPIEAPAETTFIGVIDFSSVITEVSEIEDFDVSDGYIYFIYGNSIYSMDLYSDTNTIAHIVEDTVDWPGTLKVNSNILYYQGLSAWSSSTDIKQMDLNAIAAGVYAVNTIQGVSRSQLCKYDDAILYVSSPDGFSPTNNFYQLYESATDQLVATDTYVLPKNLRVIGNDLYFSSQKEVRRLDLTNPNLGSTLVYTVPEVLNASASDGDIIGFDIKDSVIYFTQVANNKLFSIDLGNLDEAPKVLKEYNTEGITGYGKLIVANGKLYVKRIVDKQLEVFEL